MSFPTLDRNSVRYRRALDLIVCVVDNTLHKCPDLVYCKQLALKALAGDKDEPRPEDYVQRFPTDQFK